MGEQRRGAGRPAERAGTSCPDEGDRSSAVVELLVAQHLSQRKIDPRVSLVSLVLVNVMAFAAPSYTLIVVAVALDVVLLLWCGRPRLALGWAEGYALLCALFVACMMVGPALSSFGIAFLYMSKMFPAAMLASAMIATTHTGELACALQSFGLPSRVTVATCVALRFFPTVVREAHSVADAMRLRNEHLTMRAMLRHPGALFEGFIVPFVNRISIVADELGDAITVRGADTIRRRTSLFEARIGLPDGALLLAVVTLLTISFVGRLG